MTDQNPIRWADLTWPALRDHIEKLEHDGHAVGLIPFGATEQHGPHLPTGTDTLVATALCERASAATGAVVLPPVNIGVSYGHGDHIPGTLSWTPVQAAQMLTQVVDWAARSGVRRFLVVNAHAGNVAATSVALDEIRFARPDLRIGAFHWWQSSEELTRELTSDGGDVHANRAETSAVMALAPHLVVQSELEGADDPDRTGGLVFAYTATELSTNGVTGSPSLASAELGQRLLALAMDGLVDRITAAKHEEAPLRRSCDAHE